MSVQVVPVVSLNRPPNLGNGRQLGGPPTWPVPPDPEQRQTGADPRLTGYTVDESLGSGGYTSAVTIVGGRRRLSSSPGSKRPLAPQARRGARGLRADEGASTPAMSPMRKAPVKPGEPHSRSGLVHGPRITLPTSLHSVRLGLLGGHLSHSAGGYGTDSLRQHAGVFRAHEAEG